MGKLDCITPFGILLAVPTLRAHAKMEQALSTLKFGIHRHKSAGRITSPWTSWLHSRRSLRPDCLSYPPEQVRVFIGIHCVLLKVSRIVKCRPKLIVDTNDHTVASSADGPDLPDLEGVISEAESIKYSTPLFERMKSSFVRLRDAIQGLDSGLVNGKAVKRGKDFITDDSIAYDALESALLQVRPC